MDVIKYMTDSQLYTSNDILQVMNELMKQEVKSNGIQCYNIHHESSLSDLIARSDIYNNDSYVLYADWKIEKIPEANPKKIEFNINKPNTDLKKIDFNINVNNDDIDDKNNEETVHPSGDLTSDNDDNIEDHGAQHKQINQNNSFILLLKTNYNQALSQKIRMKLMSGELQTNMKKN